MTTIAIGAMGGDLAPAAAVRGVAAVSFTTDIQCILVGNERRGRVDVRTVEKLRRRLGVTLPLPANQRPRRWRLCATAMRDALRPVPDPPRPVIDYRAVVAGVHPAESVGV